MNLEIVVQPQCETAEAFANRSFYFKLTHVPFVRTKKKEKEKDEKIKIKEKREREKRKKKKPHVSLKRLNLHHLLKVK